MDYESEEFEFPEAFSGIGLDFLRHDIAQLSDLQKGLFGFITSFNESVRLSNHGLSHHTGGRDFFDEHGIPPEGLDKEAGRPAVLQSVVFDYAAYVQAQILRQFIEQDGGQRFIELLQQRSMSEQGALRFLSAIEEKLKKYPPDYQGNSQILEFLKCHLIEGEDFEACKGAVAQNYTDTDVSKLPHIAAHLPIQHTTPDVALG